MMTEGDLRALVRQTLREVLGRAGTRPDAPPATETVRIACDADLQAFVARLAAPGAIEAVRAGRLAFRLEAAPVTPACPGAAALGPRAAVAEAREPSPSFDGVVSERRLAGLAPGSRLRLAPGAVLTPLARDRVRALGLAIEREDP